MRTTPSICLSSTSSILRRKKMQMEDTMMKVTSIGRSRRHVTFLLSRIAIVNDVVSASIPESVTASPYEGMICMSIDMMKMPKPKPVVRWMKLAPMHRRIRYIVVVSTPLRLKCRRKDAFRLQSYNFFDEKSGECCNFAHIYGRELHIKCTEP